MLKDNYPKPPGHKTFNFQSITISSDFDSGNCSYAQKVGNNQFDLWIATDHPKNNYRTWFYFSINGINKGTTVTFNIKNMQNQSRILYEGLVPVYQEQGSSDWKRISEKINTSEIEYYDGWIQWSFKHNFKNSQKHYFAFFYPWSNQKNSQFLTQIQQKVRDNPNIYCYRSSIIKSIEGRSIQFLVISSNKHKTNKQEPISDQYLFKDQKKPHAFTSQKKAIILSARVHPGQVPGSHVMTGIIKAITQAQGLGQHLRDQFVFYIFPILNPDGVARGHYRVDTNGINLNRCYLNPSPKQEPSIYAIRKIILHLHEKNRFFAYLDLHAHASRKGTFIYGNCSNQLINQVKACIFPKILSMNSIDFEYQGSNFTQKNMYSKDRGDHISKQGSGRVAMFKTTKNAYCWTLQCNYNTSRINNVLQSKKQFSLQPIKIDQNSLDEKIIVEYKQPLQIQAKQFFTINTYHKLGRQICESLLDLIQKNPYSRIDNNRNNFKSVANLKMNLAVALLRMAPNRFQHTFKKIYSGIVNSQNPQINKNSLKALYYILIKDAKIQNVTNYIKTGQQSQLIFFEQKKQGKRITTSVNFRTRQRRYNSIRSQNQISVNIVTNKDQKISQSHNNFNQYIHKDEGQQFQYIMIKNQLFQQENVQNDKNAIKLEDSAEKDTKGTQNSAQKQNLISTKVICFQKSFRTNRITMDLQNFRMIGINDKKFFSKQSMRQTAKSCNQKVNQAINKQLLLKKKLKIHDINNFGSIQKRQVEAKKRIMMLRKGPSLYK